MLGQLLSWLLGAIVGSSSPGINLLQDGPLALARSQDDWQVATAARHFVITSLAKVCALVVQAVAPRS